MHAEDKENVSEVENRYYAILTALNKEIKRRESNQPSSQQPFTPPISKIRLPPIDVPIFTGKFTEYIPFINLFTSVVNDNKSVD